ncbi:hypothetical protein HOD88_00385 [archaeon]|jgi:NOL1/NOP2/fmu family ribosome biogenesis protein|nr:hypothetical protein [archaeon]
MRPPEFKILNPKEKKEVENKLKLQFGIDHISGTVLQRGAERLFLFRGELDYNHIKEIEDNVPVERIGIYFAKHAHDSIRLSIEGVQALKDQITKNIIELNEEDSKTWMYGEEVQIETGKKCYVVIKHKDYFLGCGKASEKKISNFIPKSRRLRNKNIIK